jgi:hypothetical protein
MKVRTTRRTSALRRPFTSRRRNPELVIKSARVSVRLTQGKTTGHRDRQRGDHLPDPRTDVRPRIMANLALSPTMKYFGFGDKDDYVVLDGGRVIGRIFLHPQGPDGAPWFWTITAPDIPPSIDKHGYSATRERAMVDFKARWMMPPSVKAKA